MMSAFGEKPRPRREGQIRSHRRHVLAVLDRENNARAVVETGAILFGPVVDALARGDFAFAQRGLTDRLSAGFGRGNRFDLTYPADRPIRLSCQIESACSRIELGTANAGTSTIG